MTRYSLTQAIQEMGKAGHRLDQIKACEAGAGNISVVLLDDAGIDDIFPRSQDYELPSHVPALAGRTVLVTGSGCRLREVGEDPEGTIAAVRIHEGGTTGTLRYSEKRTWQRPTSEFNSHLGVHQDQVSRTGVGFHAVVHAHPPYLVALSHARDVNDSAVFSRRVLRWEPESIIQLPEGIALLPFMVPGSSTLMENNIVALRTHQFVMWSTHGAMVRSAHSILSAVDKVEYAEAGAMFDHLNTVAGNPSDGLNDDDLRAIADAFDISTTLFDEGK